MKTKAGRIAIALGLIVACAASLPRWWCGWDSDAWLEGNRATVMPLACYVADVVQSGVGVADFKTGDDRFDGEWAFGTYQMAGLAMGQLCLAYEEDRTRFLPAMEASIEGILKKETRAFDVKAWGEDPIKTLASDRGHAAYLGYFNLVLSLHRSLVPKSQFADLNDKITEALVRRFQASTHGLIETYPREVYPVDNCPGLASIDLWSRVAGEGRYEAFVAERLKILTTNYVDAKSGFLIQSVIHDTGKPLDKPRASGTALGAYFLSFCQDTGPAHALQQALCRETGTFLGFGATAEYPSGIEAGSGDIDSGPVILGLSFSGTGFSIGPHRAFGDRAHFLQIYRTVHLFGAPHDTADRRNFVTGGPLGNAIMLAMLTTPKRTEVQK